MMTYQAWVVEAADNSVERTLQAVEDRAKDGDVRIKIAYSSLNYKDMLAMQPNGGVIRQYPLIPGIDLSGTVVESSDPRFAVGQAVLVTGYQLGTQHNGGLAEYARVPGDWIVPLPAGLSLREAMVYGTAGFTAALSLTALLQAGLQVTSRVLVTGASGGVGTVALRLLAQLGVQDLTAVVRKPEQVAFVQDLGAKHVLMADDLTLPDKPLAKQRFDFVLDTVGGPLAAALIPQVALHGAMTLCGNAGGVTLNTTVLPFILRGISVIGIDSVTATADQRRMIWQHLATDWRVVDTLVTNEIALPNVGEQVAALKAGHHVGRTVVKIGG
ncbi:YhdH/YhfP family quinone oxidoreductase [Lacticaseibacillus brantae]|uniref:YhdH/YhfP family quinone oxidoreductase n=1 Tax=Lacticaseibacillus brantae TaxID=943673 RepID=UPI00070D4640